MMKSKVLGILLMVFSATVFAQEVGLQKFEGTGPTDGAVAREQITRLKEGGAIVFRFKEASKSIEAYEQAGRPAVAERMRKEYNKTNTAIYDAFARFFTFCKVYFIKTTDTKALLAGANNIFLNSQLQVDSTITMKEKYFLIAEHGALMDNTPIAPEMYKSLKRKEETSTPVAQSTIFLSDTSLRQLQEPFPFYIVDMPSGFDATIKQFNNRLFNFYYRVAMKQEKEEIKKSLRGN